MRGAGILNMVLIYCDWGDAGETERAGERAGDAGDAGRARVIQVGRVTQYAR